MAEGGKDFEDTEDEQINRIRRPILRRTQKMMAIYVDEEWKVDEEEWTWTPIIAPFNPIPVPMAFRGKSRRPLAQLPVNVERALGGNKFITHHTYRTRVEKSGDIIGGGPTAPPKQNPSSPDGQGPSKEGVVQNVQNNENV